MRAFAQSLLNWGEDRLLRRVTRNSGYLFVGNLISALLSIATGRLLGVPGFGEIGIITNFVSSINRLLSFRMGELVVRYLGPALARKETDRAAAIVKAAALTEAVTSGLAYIVLLLLAPLGARYIIKDPSATGLIVLFGLSILGNLTTETATGVLQVGNRYRDLARITMIQSAAIAVMMVGVYLMHGGLLMVLWVYLVGKLILGLGPILVAAVHLNDILGKGWWKASLSLLPSWRELAHFGLSTNLSATLNMVVRDSEILWVGFFFGSTASGYYKMALAVINLVIMPINPFISTTYPEINTAAVRHQWDRLRDLLKKVTVIAGGWTIASALGLVLFGPWLIVTFYKHSDFLSGFPVLLVLLVGYGFANTLFWNRPLLLSLGLPDYPLKVSFWAALAKVALTIVLVPRLGYIWEAVLLSGYFVVSVGLIVWRGLREVSRAQAAQPEIEPAGVSE